MEDCFEKKTKAWVSYQESKYGLERMMVHLHPPGKSGLGPDEIVTRKGEGIFYTDPDGDIIGVAVEIDSPLYGIAQRIWEREPR